MIFILRLGSVLERKEGMMLSVGIAVMASLGALLRFYFVQKWSLQEFYWGTLSVNVIGSLLMGVAFVLYQEALVNREGYYLALTVGFLGAFTTFSSFSLEVLNLMNLYGWRQALIYIAITNIGSIFGCFVGFRLTQYVVARGA